MHLYEINVTACITSLTLQTARCFIVFPAALSCDDYDPTRAKESTFDVEFRQFEAAQEPIKVVSSLVQLMAGGASPWISPVKLNRGVARSVVHVSISSNAQRVCKLISFPAVMHTLKSSIEKILIL